MNFTCFNLIYALKYYSWALRFLGASSLMDVWYVWYQDSDWCEYEEDKLQFDYTIICYLGNPTLTFTDPQPFLVLWIYD